MGELDWLGGNRLAFLAAGVVFGFVVAMLLWIYLSGRGRSQEPTTLTVTVNDPHGSIQPGDDLVIGGKRCGKVLARHGSTLTVRKTDTWPVNVKAHQITGSTPGFEVGVLGSKAMADALKALGSAGLIHVQREGERPQEGLNLKALHSRHPSAAVVALASGQRIARLWAFRDGSSQLEFVTTNTVNPADPTHVGYLDIAENPNPFSVPGFVAQEIGKGQPQYRVLHAVRGPAPELALISRWQLTDELRAAIRDGQDIWLEQWTFGHPFQPVRLSVGVPEDLQQQWPVADPDPRD